MGLETQPGRMLLGTALGGCLAEPPWLQELQPKLFPSCRPALPGWLHKAESPLWSVPGQAPFPLQHNVHLHNSIIIIQLCLGRIRVVTAHIKAPSLIQLKHLEIKLHFPTVQMTLLFLSKKSVFSTFLQDLLSIHGAAQMEETPCLCKEVVPDDHLILILFLVI